MHMTSHPLSHACKYLLCEYAPEEPSTLFVAIYVDVVWTMGLLGEDT